MKYFNKIILFFSLIVLQMPSYAILDLVLTQGVDSAIPIAVVPFSGQSSAADTNNVANVISHDLQMSGRFKVLAADRLPANPHQSQEIQNAIWQQAGVDSAVVGSVQSVGGDQYTVSFSLADVYKANVGQGSVTPHVLLNQTFTVSEKKLRPLAHHIADLIYEKLTGVRGVFATRLAYVLVQNAGQAARYSLQVADADGYNPQAILVSNQPVMSPAWSHDGRRLAYVTFENRRAQIMLSDVATGSREMVSSYPGINGAPAWSPDDRQLALVLSKTGSPKIYILDLNSKQTRQITQGRSIDTEPTWAPDGKSIVFTSDRDGSPQLYQYTLANGTVKRLTYTGSYNARAAFTSDGKSLLMLHREADGYNIAMQDLRTGRVSILTRTGRNDSPSLSPNSSMILYGTEYGELGLVSTDGRVSLRLPAGEGKVQSPAWSPFLS